MVVQYLYVVGMIKLPQYFSLSLFRCALERVVFKGLENLDEVASPNLATNHLFVFQIEKVEEQKFFQGPEI